MIKKIRRNYILVLNSIGLFILRKYIKRKDFTIFSNDCFGAEIYRFMRLPYKTPFVGLMMMGPCYIKFLENPKYYLSYKIKFIDRSMYQEMNTFRENNNNYPLGVLNDIEIHFLHYKSKSDAAIKWARRVDRVNWNNVFYKFSVDKDYAESDHLNHFELLMLPNKLSISNKIYKFSKTNICVPNNVLDATITFRLSLQFFNLIGWLNEGQIKFRNLKEIILGRLLYYTLVK